MVGSQAATPQSRPTPGGLCRRCGYAAATANLSACPQCGAPVYTETRDANRPDIGLLSLPPMLFPQQYIWFVFVSVLDLVLTSIILLLGGVEVNVVADAVIAHTGHGGLVIYKFCLMIMVIIACEGVGRRNARLGHRLAEWAVAITAIPVALSFWQLLTHT